MRNDARPLDALPVHPGVPTGFRASSHRLRVQGLVGVPLNLDPARLAEYPQTTLVEDFACREGWVVPEQVWRGVLVGELLDAAGPLEGACWVEFAADDFAFSAPIDEARSALVALTLNGSRLTREHGGPARLVVSGAACFTSIKWLDRIEVRSERGLNHAERIAVSRLA